MSISPRLGFRSTPSFILLFVFLTSVSGSVSIVPVRETVHDILPKYGLPKGLLPSSVKSYSLSADGDFEVELVGPCYVKFSDLVYYERVIKGKLSFGAISDLSGIQAKKLFVWVYVTGIVVDNSASLIEFQVGFLSEKLPATEFENIPTCRNKASSSSCRGAAATLFPQSAISEV